MAKAAYKSRLSASFFYFYIITPLEGFHQNISPPNLWEPEIKSFSFIILPPVGLSTSPSLESLSVPQKRSCDN
jgi:hypothetical protein